MTTRQFRMLPERTTVTRDGVVTFDTDAYPVQYTPEEYTLNLSAVSVVFPDVLKGNAYCWMQWDSGDANNNPRESAISLITMVNQEWGPSSLVPAPTAGCIIEDVVLGTVPSKCDHILVRAKATRTVSPSQINGNTIPFLQKSGEWVVAHGGSLPMEWLFPIARMIHVYLGADNGDGTKNVLLRRLQSVVKQRMTFYRQGNDYNKTGWNYGGANGSVYGIPVSQRDTRGPTTDVTGIGSHYKRTGSAPASTSDNTNYGSTYSVDFEIIGGRSNITPDSGVGAGGPQFAFVDDQGGDASAAVNSRTMSFGEEAADRKLILAVAVNCPLSPLRNITQVKIGGVVASSLVYMQNQNQILGIYAAAVPTGTSGTVEVTLDNTITASVFKLFAGYNMNSLVPDDTISMAVDDVVDTLSTVDGGLAVAIGMQNANYGNLLAANANMDDYKIQIIDNSVVFPIRDTTETSQIYEFGYQLVTGTPLSLQLKSPDTPAIRGFVAVSLH